MNDKNLLRQGSLDEKLPLQKKERMKERTEKERKKERSGVALTTGEDLPVGAVEGQAEDVGQVLSLQLHWLGPTVEGLLHVPQQNPAVVST